ncbi:MAG: bifunctional DNA-formamidopyrimidine glycosylase/DNA-(apurinic or apyrimidinic site) lyase [Chloroflexi bacterium]|nr:bifunctional DNA-formamidopyrimidine glycosylase/DNA-(apurinic or apyrimidinic site) lyase [Chloroflexota bacterium]
MPELPEVETYARWLRGQGPAAGIIGRTVRAVRVLEPGILATPDPATFARALTGQRVRAVARRGKYLWLQLDGPQVLILHLGMSGRLRWAHATEPLQATRLVLTWDDGRELRYEDPRKFGRWWLTARPDAILGKLGPEPWDLTPDAFARRLRTRRARIKPLLLNQRFLAGVGNIYADEALHRAGIHPARPANTLRADEAAALLRALQAVLEAALAARGTSFDAAYPWGTYQNALRVYGRGGQVCYTCGTRIQRLRLAGRSAHVCPTCQPLPSEDPPPRAQRDGPGQDQTTGAPR